MSDVEVKREETLSREDAARRLATLAEALQAGGKIEIALGASTVKVHVPDEVAIEVEVEIDGREVELEVELKWSTGKPAGGGRAAAARRRAPAK
ncbi:amphi-Trp domain-containing protein [Amycolatopsis rhabdoformis]|uniref:Amphi-Trp domain-containing protein n=1 Tax=Amycolatopsis rhabdoformis TaxID=1448059 RepID=A0ABZ1IF31_9PSEU|nr:amphi-Trp domain-containing protein [Amycolatopsis rhabdoformis]WSE32065.1 amphi-Trp domain-containing protein [Amycolatopsis rhabdoformis]